MIEILLALAIVAGLWFLSGLIGLSAGALQGRPGMGFVLGVLLGPFGWLAALFLPRPSPRKGP